jgi:MFS family permease
MLATLRNRNFSLLWFAGFISIAGNWILAIGLPLYIYRLTESTLATSAIFAAGMLPRLLLGSVAGVFVDRWDRKRTMVIANVLMGLGLLPLLLVNSVETVWIVYIVQLFQATISQFFSPAENALLPTLVGEDQLVPANALNSLNNNLGRLIGPVIGGFVAGLFGLSGVALVDVLTFWLAALLIAFISVPAKQTIPRDNAPRNLIKLAGGVWTEWLDGLRIIRREPRIRLLFIVATLPMIGEGIFSTLIVVFISTVVGGGEVELGYFMAAQAVGGIIGSVLIGSLAKGVPLYRLLGISAIFFGLIDIAVVNYPAFVPGILPGIILMGLVGIPGVGYGTALMTMAQNATTDQYRGRVFGAFETTAACLALFGSLAAGYLGERLPVVAILSVQGSGYVVAGIMALILLRRVYAVRYSPATKPVEAAEPVENYPLSGQPLEID